MYRTEAQFRKDWRTVNNKQEIKMNSKKAQAELAESLWNSQSGAALKYASSEGADRSAQTERENASPHPLERVLSGVRFHSASDKQSCIESVDLHYRQNQRALLEAIDVEQRAQRRLFRNEIQRLRRHISRTADRNAAELIDALSPQDSDEPMMIGALGQALNESHR